MSSGVAYGELGATHHSIEDLAWTRAIADMTVIVPADPVETAQAVEAAAAYRGPVFLRLSRMPVPIVHAADYRFEIGRAARFRDGNDVTLIAAGTMVARALEAADLLAVRGVQAHVLNMATVRPIDRDAIIAAARRAASSPSRSTRPTAGWAARWLRSWSPRIPCSCASWASPASSRPPARRRGYSSILG